MCSYPNVLLWLLFIKKKIITFHLVWVWICRSTKNSRDCRDFLMKSFNPKASTVPGSCDFLFCMRRTVETIKNILGNTINPPLSLCVGTSCETHMGTDYRVLPSKTAHLYTVVISFVLKIFRNKRRRPQKSFCVHCILI